MSETQREMSPEDIAGQKRQWDDYADEQRAKGLCEFSGLGIHSCHRSICDCFDAWGCEQCKEATP